ncbi:hypothetical protein NO1_1004 [Candidatus Termititenax aidoneus]|uniref:Uncharacterized protein n=1 Tax=Termititenax aidoneus TaxID=2218524 RepID=A0A388TBC9_TERA1|nr:hypothetical protein NO1_1004 [Candidatus Termititenax aidoneus]
MRQLYTDIGNITGRINNLSPQQIRDLANTVQRFVPTDITEKENYQSDEFFKSKGNTSNTGNTKDQTYTINSQPPANIVNVDSLNNLIASKQEVLLQKLWDNMPVNNELEIAHFEKVFGELRTDSETPAPEGTESPVNTSPNLSRANITYTTLADDTQLSPEDIAKKNSVIETLKKAGISLERVEIRLAKSSLGEVNMFITAKPSGKYSKDEDINSEIAILTDQITDCLVNTSEKDKYAVRADKGGIRLNLNDMNGEDSLETRDQLAAAQQRREINQQELDRQRELDVQREEMNQQTVIKLTDLGVDPLKFRINIDDSGNVSIVPRVVNCRAQDITVLLGQLERAGYQPEFDNDKLITRLSAADINGDGLSQRTQFTKNLEQLERADARTQRLEAKAEELNNILKENGLRYIGVGYNKRTGELTLNTSVQDTTNDYAHYNQAVKLLAGKDLGDFSFTDGALSPKQPDLYSVQAKIRRSLSENGLLHAGKVSINQENGTLEFKPFSFSDPQQDQGNFSAVVSFLKKEYGDPPSINGYTIQYA